MTEENKKSFSFQVLERIAVLSTDSNGWTKELNRISYNGKPAVWDLRKWSPNGKLSRGITLKEEERRALTEALHYIETRQGETTHGSSS